MAEEVFLRAEDPVAAEGHPAADFGGACWAELANLGPTWVSGWTTTTGEREAGEDGASWKTRTRKAAACAMRTSCLAKTHTLTTLISSIFLVVLVVVNNTDNNEL